jgi:hypothetical protein
MEYIGTNIYYWGINEQKRLLQLGLHRWAEEAIAHGLLEQLWYCVFDIRGPHIFATFGTSPANSGALKSRLVGQISKFLRDSPSQASLETEELLQRHNACRSKIMNRADLIEDIASNNSFVVFEHDKTAYPFQATHDMAHDESLWQLLAKVCFWTLEQPDDGKQAAAIHWIAAVDHSLRNRMFPANDYWRFHASTILTGLEQQLESKPGFFDQLQNRAISKQNRQTFDRAWHNLNGFSSSASADEVVETIMSDPNLSQQRQFEVLREVNHFTLLQLGQTVSYQLPMVLYAWQRNS